MNIYEQLNKIDDTESLSEKYNIKNAKELKKLQNSSEALSNNLRKDNALNEWWDDDEEESRNSARGDRFYRRAERALEKNFKCTGAYLEPSTELGSGKTYLFADNMDFDGSFDFETGEEYIDENDYKGFLQLCLDSFTPSLEESLKEDV